MVLETLRKHFLPEVILGNDSLSSHTHTHSHCTVQSRQAGHPEENRRPWTLAPACLGCMVSLTWNSLCPHGPCLCLSRPPLVLGPRVSRFSRSLTWFLQSALLPPPLSPFRTWLVFPFLLRQLTYCCFLLRWVFPRSYLTQWIISFLWTALCLTLQGPVEHLAYNGCSVHNWTTGTWTVLLRSPPHNLFPETV